MSEEKKERKPLLEALASVTDGLDVLVGLEKEKKEGKKEEKPEERRASDTFGGLLQSMVPLLIIPQILPLFQQALGQTLQSTTVNVKVESSTTLIPISIEATTVIIPIEIRASQVTLNVAIKQSDVTLKISIENSVVTLDVRITNTSLNVVVTNSSLNVVVTNTTLDINIINSVVNLKVINPAGIPLYTAEPVSVTGSRVDIGLGPGTSYTIRNVTGRCRLLAVTISALTTDGYFGLFKTKLRIIVDGVVNEFTFAEISMWNGGRVFELSPDPTVRPEMEAPTLSNLGGWAYARATSTTQQLSLVVQQKFDVVSSLRVELVVPPDGVNVSFRTQTVVGFYP